MECRPRSGRIGSSFLFIPIPTLILRDSIKEWHTEETIAVETLYAYRRSTCMYFQAGIHVNGVETI